MNREKLYQHLDQHYVSKREMISRLPLDVQPDEIWQDILNRRRVRSTMLPIHSPRGNPYWYVTTQKMATASDRIISEMMENETEFDPYRNLPATTCLEESFFILRGGFTAHHAGRNGVYTGRYGTPVR